MIGIGVIGYGYWGPNLVRNFMEAPGSTVKVVCDLRPGRLSEVSNRYPSVKTTQTYSDLLNEPSVDAIAIATPVSSHFDLAMQALKVELQKIAEERQPFWAGKIAEGFHGCGTNGNQRRQKLTSKRGAWSTLA